MTKLSNKTIKELLKIIDDTEKRHGDNFPWKWENLVLETDEDGNFMYLPEGSYLGNTNICLNEDYVDAGEDCLLIEHAIYYFKPMLKEILKLREKNLKS